MLWMLDSSFRLVARAVQSFGLGAELLVIRLPPGASLGELAADWFSWGM